MDSAFMKAIVTLGNGGYDMLAYRDVALPVPARGDVLLQVLAAGVNNTDVNTRLGWYAQDAKAGVGWSGATPFPLIQGADCCGRVVALGSGGDSRLVGARVLVRPCMRSNGWGSLQTRWMGSDFDGAFAQFVKVPESEVFAVRCDWSDAELATLPCAYGTAENMLHRAGLRAGEHLLVAGASGGVGSAVVQLARRRGAQVTAITSATKRDKVRALGADQVLTREDDLIALLGEESVDMVADNVAGPGFAAMLKVLRRGGRYASSGAIGGPQVALDMRDFYLKDLTLFGSTAWDQNVFPDLVAYVERREIRPLLAATFALEQMAEAQRMFLDKQHLGNIVLVPAQ